MEGAELPALEYVETPSTVTLILHNIVDERLAIGINWVLKQIMICLLNIHGISEMH
jgi:hypothetical protein